MEIRHLKLVKTVAEEGSLTRAGKKLFLTQPALSHQLKEIEAKFGTPLFQRVNKKMILTQVGHRVLETANTVLFELERTRQDIEKVVNGESGLLRISTECYTCYHWLPPLLKSYQKHFPNVDIRIIAEATRQPEKFLLDGRLDVGIVSSLTRQDHNLLEFTELFCDDLVVVINSEHRLAGQKVILPADFADEHLICYTAPQKSLDVFQRILVPNGVTPKKLSKIQLTEAIIEMVKAGLGITLMARWAVRPYLRSKRLKIIPVAGKPLTRIWYAATTKGHGRPHYIDCFIKHLFDHPIAQK